MGVRGGADAGSTAASGVDAGSHAAAMEVRAGAGAAAVAADGALSGFSVGAPADFFSLDGDDVTFAGRAGDQLLDTFIFAGGDRCIDGVWRAGRKVVSGGRHHQRSAIEARYRATLERLLRA